MYLREISNTSVLFRLIQAHVYTKTTLELLVLLKQLDFGYYTPPIFKSSKKIFRFKIQIVRNLHRSPNTITSSPNTTWSINCKTTLPWLFIGEYGSNTPWLCRGVFEPYSPLPRLGVAVLHYNSKCTSATVFKHFQVL
jgi:hypothetical protein